MFPEKYIHTFASVSFGSIGDCEARLGFCVLLKGTSAAEIWSPNPRIPFARHAANQKTALMHTRTASRIQFPRRRL